MSALNIETHSRLVGRDLHVEVRELTLADLNELYGLMSSLGLGLTKAEHREILTHSPGYSVGAFLQDGGLASTYSIPMIRAIRDGTIHFGSGS